MKTHTLWLGLIVMTACSGAAETRSALTPLAAESKTMTALPEPKTTIVDRTLAEAQIASMTLAARRYFGFWDTGDPSLARAALSAGFVDHTLPPGRPQGPTGPLFASEQFRRAVPDLRCTIDELLLVGERAVARLHFSGHFTGTFGPDARQGDGRPVDFIATDIYRIDNGQIVEDWHLEDNLTLLQQLGVVPT